jgi:thiamine-phosphate pyrophosphorylase
MSRALPPTLLALSPGDLDGDPAREPAVWLESLAAAVAAGLGGLLLREARLSDSATLRLLESIRERHPDLAWLGVHDRVHLARAAGADGVHLGFRSLTPLEARRVVGDEVAIGFSAHAHDRGLEREGADYLLLGPVWDTPSKRGRVEPVGLSGLRAEIARSSSPVWAIGGLTPPRALEALQAGARGAAVLGDLLGAEQPASRVRAFTDVISGFRSRAEPSAPES